MSNNNSSSQSSAAAATSTSNTMVGTAPSGLDAALANVNIDDNFNKAEAGDPIPISNVTIDVKLHRSGVLKISKSLKRVLKDCSSFDEAAKYLLILALALTLEQHATCATVTHTKDGYDANISTLAAELKSCEGEPATDGNIQEFGNLIAEFANKALAVTTAPTSSAVSIQNADPAPSPSPAQANTTPNPSTISMQNTDPAPSLSPEEATIKQEAENELNEPEPKVLEPLKAPTIALNCIPLTLRREGLVHMCKRLKHRSALAFEHSRYSERLNGLERANCSQFLEKELLASMQQDLRGMSQPPTPQQIKEEYENRINQKTEEFEAPGKFIALARRFHQHMKKVQEWMMKKLKKLSCFGSNGPAMMHVDDRERTWSATGMGTPIQPHPQHQPSARHQPQQQNLHHQEMEQQQPYSLRPPSTPRDPRAELKSRLRDTIQGMNCDTVINTDCPFLPPGQSRNMADMLEKLVFDEILKKHEQRRLHCASEGSWTLARRE
ncbi:hypothetical protein CC86DRAFT_421572 [Ophiobolus disseminans]|uniref:Uncharacterized protein n=1 Tax=Ophiobolus disseminans TaxID=1469910 RepID=A0A6A6ZSV1_9PLEO|nr:hypothetical protein CC86DRAFT_421572 [Ophiobolus disseminans]